MRRDRAVTIIALLRIDHVIFLFELLLKRFDEHSPLYHVGVLCLGLAVQLKYERDDQVQHDEHGKDPEAYKVYYRPSRLHYYAAHVCSVEPVIYYHDVEECHKT